MLGVYANFPRNIYNILVFSSNISSKRLQQALAGTLYVLNDEVLDLEKVAMPSLLNCTVAFEIGIAEDSDFSYLDAEERDILLKTINKKPLEIMDFLCLIRYHKKQEEKEIPLKSDYYILRFTFAESSVEIQIFHEKGPVHISPGELAEFLTNRINGAFSKRVLKPVETY